MSDLLDEAAAIASDRDSGASELVARLLPVLDAALARSPELISSIVRRVCGGQPAMAPIWHVCAAALCETERPGTFASAQLSQARAPAALTRVASGVLLEELAGVEQPLVLSHSFSRSAHDVLQAIHALHPLRVVCGEGRPRYEGRRLAESLARTGIETILTSDAGVGPFLPAATAVVVGADAIAASFFVNKAGTSSLAALARLRGVPVFVVATADKAFPAALAERWNSPPADPIEVWPDPPPGVRVENRYFEAIPAEWVHAFLTDVGPLTPDDLPAFSERASEPLGRVLELLRI